MGEDLHGRFPADLCKPSLQSTHTGFSGVGGDDGADGFVGDADLALFQAVLLQLLGNQMILSDHQLLLVGIGAQLDDLHAIQQGPGHGIQSVGGGDEHHVGQIKGNFQIVIPISGILLAVQHLQQCGAGVTTVIMAQLVDLIQQQDGITGAGLSNGLHDSTGHGTHIGLPVTTDLGLVVNTAQGDTGHFPVQAPGDGIGNGGLAHTGRAHQTQDLGRHFRSHLADSQGFQDPLLHLFHAEMLRIQDLAGCGNINALLGGLVPGNFQHGIQVIAQHRAFGGAEGLLLQPVNVLQKLLFLVLRQLQLLDFGGICIAFIQIIAFAQLLTDGLHLLAQIVVPLILVDGNLGFLLDDGFQL